MGLLVSSCAILSKNPAKRGAWSSICHGCCCRAFRPPSEFEEIARQSARELYEALSELSKVRVPSGSNFRLRISFADIVRKPFALSACALTLCMSDDLENLRRVVRLVEEMDAYFAKIESAPSASRNSFSSSPTWSMRAPKKGK